jgi:hypothetical protein
MASVPPDKADAVAPSGRIQRLILHREFFPEVRIPTSLHPDRAGAELRHEGHKNVPGAAIIARYCFPSTLYAANGGITTQCYRRLCRGAIVMTKFTLPLGTVTKRLRPGRVCGEWQPPAIRWRAILTEARFPGPIRFLIG